MALTKITNSAIADDIGLGGNPTTSTQTAGDSTTRIATTAFVSTAVANLVDSAPDTLNTLAELATSIGNSTTLSSTLTSSIATKLPLAGGTLTGNLNLGDNVRARFGLDSDLQIYHDGSHSYIDDTGTGHLFVRSNGDGIYFRSSTNEEIAHFNVNGSVKLYHDNAEKLVTTATGIDVTGNIVVSGTVDGIDIAARDAVLTSTTTTAGAALPKAGGTMTGTLNVTQASTADTIKLTRGATNHNNMIKFVTGSSDKWIVGQRNDSTDHFRFYSYGTSSDVVSILTSGNVGIGTASPGAKLHVAGAIVSEGGSFTSIHSLATDAGLVIQRNDYIYSNDNSYLRKVIGHTSTGIIEIGQGGTSLITDIILKPGSTGNVRFFASGSEDVRINSSGNVGIGTIAPDAKLRIDQDVGTVGLKVTGGSGGTNIAEFVRDVGANVSVGINGESARPQIKFTSAGNTFALGVNSNTFEIADNNALGTNTRFSITNAGNVGIGTSTPHGMLQFDNSINTRKIVLYEGADNDYQFYGFGIEGSTLVYSTYSDTDDHVFFSGASSSSRNELMRIEGGGNVGIGTSAPTAKLHVNYSVNASVANLAEVDNYSAARFGPFRADTDDNLYFMSIGGSKVGIQARDSTANGVTKVLSLNPFGGNVGIGTTAPSVGLQVGNSTLGETKTVIFNSEGGAEVGLSVTSRTNRAKIRVSDNDTSGYLVSEGGVFGVGMTGSISNNNINILANGNIGMGTSAPQSFTKLDVRSNGSLSGSSAIAAYGYHGESVTILGNGYATSGTGTNIGVKGISTGSRASDSGSVNIGGNFYATGAENNYALITGAGNVGIGTASPTAKLHISGNSDVSDEDCQLIIDDVDGSAGSRIPSIQFRSVTGGTTTNQGRIRATDTQGMILSGSSAQGDDLVVKAGKVGVGMIPVEVLDLKAASGDTRLRLDAVSGSDTEIKFFNAGAAQYTVGHDDATDNFVIGTINVDAPLVSISKAGNISLNGGGTIEAPSVGGGEPLILKAAGGITAIIDSNGNGGDDQFFSVQKHTGTNLLTVQETGAVEVAGTLNSNGTLSATASVGVNQLFKSTYNYGSNRDWAFRTNNYGSSNWGGFSLEQSTGQQGTPSVARIGVHMNGNVGINMGGDASSGLTSINPATALHVGGDITVGSADAVGTGGTASIRFQNDNERSRITSNYASGGGGEMGFWTDTTGGTLLNRAYIKNDGSFNFNGNVKMHSNHWNSNDVLRAYSITGPSTTSLTRTINVNSYWGFGAQGGAFMFMIHGWQADSATGMVHWHNNGSNNPVITGVYLNEFHTATGLTVSVAKGTGDYDINISLASTHSNTHGWYWKVWA